MPKVVEPIEDTLLPDDLDAPAETLYRPRQRNMGVKRSRFQRLRPWIGWGLLVLVAMIPLTYGGLRALGYALHSPRFLVTGSDDVSIDGNQYVSREEVLGAMGLSLFWNAGRGVNIFRLNLDEERREIESISWVRAATVTRVLPHHLAVHIVERKPIAFVNMGGRVMLIDSEGILLEKPEKSDFTFPVLEGLGEPANLTDRLPRLALYQDFMQQLSSPVSSAGWLISEVNLADAEDLRALLVQGRENIEVHFGRSKFSERFTNFLNLLPDMRKSNAKIDSVDLRYHNQVIVNPQDPDEGQTSAEK